MIFDTGPLVAAANLSDPDHQRSTEVLRATSVIVVPGPVVAEAGYLIGRIGGPEAEAAFLRSISTDRYSVVAPDRLELLRAAELVLQYGDAPIGTTDAIVMAMAESRGDPLVATLDRRHFSIVRPRGFTAFDIKPD